MNDFTYGLAVLTIAAMSIAATTHAVLRGMFPLIGSLLLTAALWVAYSHGAYMERLTNASDQP